MTSFARLKPIYVSLSTHNNGINSAGEIIYSAVTSPDSAVVAQISTDFREPILEKASDFIMAVERMELSLNGIPFYDSQENLGLGGHDIVIRSRLNSALTTVTTVDLNAYNLSQLFEILSYLEYENPNDNSVFDITYSISKDGFVVVKLGGGVQFTNIQIEFPRVLNNILGISTAVQLINSDTCASSYPRVDLGDDLDHIVLRTNLPTFTDALGNVRTQILTDFCPPTTYSNSMAYDEEGKLVRNGFTTNIRQKAIYIPSERRYLELQGDFPISNITVTALYVNQDGNLKNVPLVNGGLFELKLGFYLRQ